MTLLNIQKSPTLETSESCLLREVFGKKTDDFSNYEWNVGWSWPWKPTLSPLFHLWMNDDFARCTNIRCFWLKRVHPPHPPPPPPQPTPLGKVVWNIRESCGRPRSTQTLDFLPRWHCVRETDVNSRNRDTCVRFMCCLLDDVWCCLKCF